MKHEPTGVREGLVTVHTGYRDGSVLKGLNVMGRDKDGTLINRTVLVSRDSPAWFQKLCYQRANSGFKIRVKIKTLYKGDLAFAIPVAASLEEAMAEWEQMRPKNVNDPDVKQMTPDQVDYAQKAHEYWASVNSFKIVEHHYVQDRVRSTALDPSGEKMVITGGFIVSCMKDRIQSGTLDWETQVNQFVRARPMSTIPLKESVRYA